MGAATAVFKGFKALAGGLMGGKPTAKAMIKKRAKAAKAKAAKANASVKNKQQIEAGVSKL